MTIYQHLLSVVVRVAQACQTVLGRGERLAYAARVWAWDARQSSHDRRRKTPKTCACRRGENCFDCRLVPLNVACVRCKWRGTEREYFGTGGHGETHAEAAR